MLNVKDYMPENLVHTLQMRAFGILKVPLLFIASPRVVRIDDQTCEVMIPFRKVVKNHLGSMYFGALAIGADTCVGYLAFDKIKKSKKNVQLVFKDFKANFIRRSEGHTLFICDEGELIQKSIDQAALTGERINQTIRARAEALGEKVADFELTLSLKIK